MLLVRSHLAAASIVLLSVVSGLLVARARPWPRAGWPERSGPPPTQVAEFAAVTTGIVIVLWLGGVYSGRVALFTVVTAWSILLLTYTSIPRTKFQDLFGFGLSNKSFDGLPRGC